MFIIALSSGSGTESNPRFVFMVNTVVLPATDDGGDDDNTNKKTKKCK